jgi:hypothetical protein
VPSQPGYLANSHLYIDRKTKTNHDYTAASSISKTNRESQSGYNSISHPGLHSYQLGPKTYDVSKTALSQGAASEPLLEPKPKVNLAQRPLSSSSKPRPTYESQTIPTRKPLPTHIHSSLKIPTGDKASPVLSQIAFRKLLLYGYQVLFLRQSLFQ